MEFTVVQADWVSHQNQLRSIRTEVFVNEQKVPVAEEWDQHDTNALHFLALHKQQAVGCVRLLQAGKLTRMAVLKPFRNQGVGSALIETILQHAKTTGLKSVYLEAQVPAVPLYQKFGFTLYGDFFLDAGIQHIMMRLHLT